MLRIKNILLSRFLNRQLDRRASNCILLTFDDGPHSKITEAVLDRLKAYDARAVFFIVGRRIEKAPHILKRIHEQGHVIGNHTYIHSNDRQPWFLAYWRDVIRCQSLIEEHTRKRPKLFRPPSGRISLSSLLVPMLLRLRTVMWSLEGGDWNCRSPEHARLIGEDLARMIVPKDIVLLHDDNPSVLIILDILLPVLKTRNLDLSSGIEFLSKGVL